MIKIITENGSIAIGSFEKQIIDMSENTHNQESDKIEEIESVVDDYEMNELSMLNEFAPVVRDGDGSYIETKKQPIHIDTKGDRLNEIYKPLNAPPKKFNTSIEDALSGGF